MNLFDKIRKDVVLSSIIYLVLGLILLFRPGTALVTIVDVLAIMTAVMGVIRLVTYFARKDAIADGALIKGILYLILAAVLYFGAGFIISIVPIIMGVLVIISGIVKLQEAMDMMKVRVSGYVPMLLISILSLVFGVVILLNPFATAELLFRIIGIALIYNAVSDLLTVFYFSKKTRY
ncbi:MAG: HdeD family acid-resistance protein [Lachnospiraceae bacterium]